MDTNNTVLVVAFDGGGCSTLVESLGNCHGYRVLRARSFDEATAVLDGVQVDLVIAEQGSSGHDGCEFLAALRTSHPEIVRVLVFDGRTEDIMAAAVYQFLHPPLDPEQACLVVKRGLEAGELARRHRLLSRELKLSDHNPLDGAQSLAPATRSLPWASQGKTLKDRDESARSARPRARGRSCPPGRRRRGQRLARRSRRGDLRLDSPIESDARRSTSWSRTCSPRPGHALPAGATRGGIATALVSRRAASSWRCCAPPPDTRYGSPPA